MSNNQEPKDDEINMEPPAEPVSTMKILEKNGKEKTTEDSTE